LIAGVPAFVGILLFLQAGFIAYSGSRHSPTHAEPAFLASGLSHWKHGGFELYRVNPPLVRMIAAVPSVVVGAAEDWSRIEHDPGSRPEFPVGEDFTRVNGARTIWLIQLGRWFCLPFSLLGAYVAWCWARDLYGPMGGRITLLLYVLEPNLLGHGELLTTDAACTSLVLAAGYTFWKWLRVPTWAQAGLAGAVLALVLLTKFSGLPLLGLWPVLWLGWRWSCPNPMRCRDSAETSTSTMSGSPPAAQLLFLLSIAFFGVNAGYGFQGTGTRLGDFQFVSQALAGSRDSNGTGNRFRGGWLAEIPVPLPRDAVLGIDSQKKDFEEYGRKSFLHGSWKESGWWYYYLYGLLVKVPEGTLGLLGIAGLMSVFGRGRIARRDEFVLIAPVVVLAALVSSQPGMNLHHRYVLPCIGLLMVFAGRVAILLEMRRSDCRIAIAFLLVAAVAGSIASYPHHLSYFNSLVGGPRFGHRHMLESNVDWGQDLLRLQDWYLANGRPRPFYVDYSGMVNPRWLGIQFDPVPRSHDDRISLRAAGVSVEPRPGWYAISVNRQENCENYGLPANAYAWLKDLAPVASAGYSIRIYRVTERDVTAWESLQKKRIAP